jgi:hypothetical protein
MVTSIEFTSLESKIRMSNSVMSDPRQTETALEVQSFQQPVAIKTTDDYRRFVELRAAAKTWIEQMDLKFKPMVTQALASVNLIRQNHRIEIEPVEKFITEVDKQCSAFERIQEDRRRREEIRQAEQAEKEAQESRKLEVQHLKRTGYVADAKKLAAEPLPPVVAPTVPLDVPKVSGFSKRTLWEAEVTDFKALVEAVAAGKASLECLLPNQTVLNALARAAKTTLAIPGVMAKDYSSRTQRRG